MQTLQTDVDVLYVLLFVVLRCPAAGYRVPKKIIAGQ